MMLSIIRKTYTDKSTIGYLSLDGVFQCYTLELPKRNEMPCCILSGSYKGAMQWSNHFQRVVPHILNVPFRTNIEIHNGDFPSNTEGCVLVGQTRGVDVIGNSDLALDALIEKLPNTFDIEVIDTDAPETT